MCCSLQLLWNKSKEQKRQLQSNGSHIQMCKVNELPKGDTVLFPNNSVLGSSVVSCENGLCAQANNHFITLNCHLEIVLIYQV